MCDVSSLAVLPMRPAPGFVALLVLLSALGERLEVCEFAVLPVRPRKPNLAYFSWPVPATGPFLASRFGFSVDFSKVGFDFRERKLNRGDLLGGAGEGGCLTAGESLRSNRGCSGSAESGVASRKGLFEEGDGENAESTRGDACLDEDRGEKPKRLRKLVEVADPLVSCDGVLLWYVVYSFGRSLCTTGDGSLRCVRLGVRSRLGLLGWYAVLAMRKGASTFKCASSGGTLTSV